MFHDCVLLKEKYTPGGKNQIEDLGYCTDSESTSDHHVMCVRVKPTICKLHISVICIPMVYMISLFCFQDKFLPKVGNLKKRPSLNLDLAATTLSNQ